ncbi:MAG TPA: NUDIX domain-containing protein [Nevskiaceae bacterium]|nr:NUDIX domain-containing protein [Nevskiaceae bacterium]
MADKVTVADEKIDHRRGIDHIGVSASFIVHDGNGNVLLHKRGPKCRDEQGRWDVGGGAIEFGESIDDAVRREVKEELCTEPLDIQFLTVYDAHREHNGVKTHWIAIIHTVLVDPATVKIGEPDKMEALEWFNSKNLPSPLHSQFWKSYQPALDQGIAK